MSSGRLPSAGSAGCGRPGCPADGPHRHALPQVRVFTFSVGQHNYDVTPLQWMACANKGERGWLLAGVGGCRAPGSPLMRGLALVRAAASKVLAATLEDWTAGQPNCQTGREPALQLPLFFFSKVTTSKFPPSVPSASTRRYGRVPAWQPQAELPSGVPGLGVRSGSPSPAAESPKASGERGGELGSRAELLGRPRAIEISNSSSAAPHGLAVF